MLGGQKAKGTFKIMKQESKNEKVGLKIGLVKFHKELSMKVILMPSTLKTKRKNNNSRLF